MFHARHISTVAVFTLAACGGGGGNGGGGGGGGGDPPPAATLASIQANVFTPICTDCHAGAGAPVGLRLEDGMSFAMLVNVPSAEVPALQRVEPGNPDDSYLIQKLEGTAAVGGRMPLSGAPLPQATIDVIRQWITDGATETTAMTPAGRAATLELLMPVPEADARAEEAPPVAELLIAADRALDATLVNAVTVTLQSSGGDGRFSEGNERSIAHRLILTSQAPSVFRLIPDAPLGPDRYRLTFSGTAPLALAGLDAVPIDGDRDGLPGGDFVAEFVAGVPR